MAKTIPVLLLLALPAIASAQETPASISLLVNEANAEAVAAKIGPALAAKDTVTRAAAARVALVRGLTAVLPQVRDALSIETDPDAARVVHNQSEALGLASSFVQRLANLRVTLAGPGPETTSLLLRSREYTTSSVAYPTSPVPG